VLPVWVAEMDVPLADAVVRAVTDALALGDTGYPAGSAYAEALAGFAERRWGWNGLAVEHTRIVPDVMLGVVEMLRLVTGPGDPVVLNPPVYPPFFQFVTHLDRRAVEAPLGADLRIDLGALEDAFRRAVEGGRRAAYLLCSPHNRRARCTPPPSWPPSPPSPSGTACGSWPTRSTHRSWPRAPPSCPT
jgi:cystathionine beta-lyase